MPNVLLTGGTGYIGSHTCVEVIAAGWQPIIIDNLSNSLPRVIDRVQEIAGVRPLFIEADVRDHAAVDQLFREHAIDAVVHFAGLKAVGESVARPLEYYDNNVAGTLVLVRAMQAHGVRRIVFSSSATVYGISERMPLTEESPVAPINPYGRTKLMIEEILRDVASSDPAWNVALLRYFNPVGAHPSGRIGEHPAGIPNNIMPFVSQVAVGRRERFNVFGGDYPTPDGTGVRDYVHVSDLARGHVTALRHMMATDEGRVLVLNLGTGRGCSVLEVIRAFERASGREIPFHIAGRRAGDAAVCYADARRAKEQIGWRAERDLDEMCRDAWRWQSGNPDGYDG
jgi:UDP-glucose 4-epimerase